MPGDYNLTSDQLRVKYGSWGSHPRHPVEDWQAEVADDETRLGYWDWLEQRIAIDQDDNETIAPAEAGE